MEGGGEGNGVDADEEHEGFPPAAALGRRKYTPVVAHDNDPAMLEMSPVDLGSSSSSFPPQDLKYFLWIFHF